MPPSSDDAFGALLDQIEQLRDPTTGCPWDRAQDHVSLRPYMLEEAYEAVAAIDSGEPAALCDELGDVLLQVVLHAQIASESGEFTITDVIEGLTAKLIRRHPHVFGDASADLPDILRRWNDIKSQEHRYDATLPPLVEARKFVDARLRDEGERRFSSEGLDAEECAGLGILRAVAEAWRSGFEPEIALRKAVDCLRKRDEDPS